jgi:Circularly permutated YpsA SLOG family
MIKKIISGGQTGADQGGLEIAKELGIETGGTAPWNWSTEKGSDGKLLKSYGLVAGPYDTTTYTKRTAMNVQNSDGTAIFGHPYSSGSRLTIKFCDELLKPRIVAPNPSRLAEWIETNHIEVLNVAGNRESRNPGIKESTKVIIREAIRLLREEK